MLEPLCLRRVRADMGAPVAPVLEFSLPADLTLEQCTCYRAVLTRFYEVLADPKPPRHSGLRWSAAPVSFPACILSGSNQGTRGVALLGSGFGSASRNSCDMGALMAFSANVLRCWSQASELGPNHRDSSYANASLGLEPERTHLARLGRLSPLAPP